MAHHKHHHAAHAPHKISHGVIAGISVVCAVAFVGILCCVFFLCRRRRRRHQQRRAASSSTRAQDHAGRSSTRAQDHAGRTSTRAQDRDNHSPRRPRPVDVEAGGQMRELVRESPRRDGSGGRAGDQTDSSSSSTDDDFDTSRVDSLGGNIYSMAHSRNMQAQVAAEDLAEEQRLAAEEKRLAAEEEQQSDETVDWDDLQLELAAEQRARQEAELRAQRPVGGEYELGELHLDYPFDDDSVYAPLPRASALTRSPSPVEDLSSCHGEGQAAAAVAVPKPPRRVARTMSAPMAFLQAPEPPNNNPARGFSARYYTEVDMDEERRQRTIWAAHRAAESSQQAAAGDSS